MNDTVRRIKRIEQDFANRDEPFDDIEFPEERLLKELPHNSMEDRAKIVSIFATLDYNRNAGQLVDNIIELHDRQPNFFDAWKIHKSENVLEQVFEDIGFRYPSRDSSGWHKNNQILRENYSGKWTELLLTAKADAEGLVELLRDEEFLYLKGDKIAPMYARFIDQYVAPMDNLWVLEIPVDTHIRRLSLDLFDDWVNVTTDDDIREVWMDRANKYGIERHVVDGALWQIGNNWDDWGEGYWDSLDQKV